jgi:hypothetical protein
MFSKKWNTADITINWKNTPASIKDLYSGYIMEPDTNISQQDFNNLKKFVSCNRRRLF